jgi:hypothetical protein
MCEKELLLILLEITDIVDVTPNDGDLGTKVREFFEKKRINSYINRGKTIYNNDNDWGQVSGY